MPLAIVGVEQKEVWWIKDSLQGGTISRQLTCTCFDSVNVTHLSVSIFKWKSHLRWITVDGDGFLLYY